MQKSFQDIKSILEQVANELKWWRYHLYLILLFYFVYSVAEKVKAPFLRWPRSWSHLRSSSGSVVESLEALCDDYMCLVASNKQKINWKEVKKSTEKLGSSKSERGFVQNIAQPSLFCDRFNWG